MKRSTVLAGLGLILLATAPGVRAETDTPAVLSEKINFNTVCVRADESSPACDSTEYTLTTGSSDGSVGSSFDVTPIGWALYQLDGAYQVNTFTADDTLRDSYTLIGGSVITGQITLSGFVGGGEVGVDSAVEVTLAGRTVKPDGKFTTAVIGSAEVTKIVSTPVDTVYEFEITVPEGLDGKPVDRLTADLGQRHITVLQNGFIDASGGSFFELPYVAPVEG